MAKSFAKEITAAYKDVESKMIQAEVAALNRAAKTALSRTIRLIRETYNIKLKDINPYITFVKANKNKRVVQIKFKEQPIPLYKFGAKVKGKRKHKRGEVIARVKKGESKIYKGAFIATGKYGESVFIRKSKQRGPLKELYGPSSMQLFGSEKAQAELEKVFFERLEIEMQYAINHFVK